MGKGNIYLIHTNAVIRRAIRDVLYQGSEYTVIPFVSEDDFLEALEFISPGCVLAEVTVEKLDCHDLITAVAERRNDLPVIALCGSCDPHEIVQIVKLGAVDVFDLESSGDDLLLTVEKIFAGLPERIRLAGIDKMAKERVSFLTSREQEILRHIVHGMISKQIAHKMGLSVRTVEMHRSNILKRMHVKSMGDCVHLFHLAFRGSVFDDLVA